MKTIARELYDVYFKSAQAHPRGMVAKLCNIVGQIERACQKQLSNPNSNVLAVSINSSPFIMTCYGNY